MSYESYFDAKIRKVGNSKVITIPIETIEKLELDEKIIIEVGIKRRKNSNRVRTKN
ncbi:hypothetical protein KY361_07315 [Candidatus Woesearchaeota archaeon]|nr:hypothetical protein [Candidatus Woesearchaeota archaeon]